MICEGTQEPLVKVIILSYYYIVVDYRFIILASSDQLLIITNLLLSILITITISPQHHPHIPPLSITFLLPLNITSTFPHLSITLY